jgi:hypothetical protein
MITSYWFSLTAPKSLIAAADAASYLGGSAA